MRPLKRNQVPTWYARYLNKTQDRDSDGNYTGNWTVHYGDPKKLMCNVSPGSGVAVRSLFGVSPDYDKTLVPDHLPDDLDEQCAMWIDHPPVIGSGGHTDTPHDYVVKRIAASINGCTIAVKRVK